MVSKLLLAVGENICRKANNNPSLQGGVWGRLVRHYEQIREGIGSHKSPSEYGSFPFDPYSHTPSMAGVQQPGMTGQVKEDIISRFFELGVSVRNGQITFCPTMLTDSDFKDGELRFSYCGTEIIYRLRHQSSRASSAEKGKLPITNYQSPITTLSREDSAHIFARDGVIKHLVIDV